MADIKLLVIEDNEDDVFLVKKVLGDLGYEHIFIAENGEDGIEIAKKENPDIIILDTILPGKDGFQICEEIKKIPEINSKVIINTGNIDAIDATKARKAGADEYVAKTSDFQYVIEAIKKITSSNS